MTTRRLGRALLGAALVSLALPVAANADLQDAVAKGKVPDSVAINTMWVMLAALLVMFMQAGFAFLEIGFSRGKNAGTVVAKILTNFSIAAHLYWAVGFAFAFGNGDRDRSRTASSCATTATRRTAVRRSWASPTRRSSRSGSSSSSFCAVSLAIVWGTTLERIKFGVYVIYAIVFAALIYPIALALGLRRRLAAVQRRHAGLRRLDRGPPDRRHRRARGAAAARRAPRQVRPGRQAAGDPRAQHAAVRARRADPVARLVRVQPGLDAERARRPLPRDRDRHACSRPPPA